MGFTPKQWTTGNRVTSTDLNRIENGIASAGGCACVGISASGFSSGSKMFGYIVYAHLDNNSWVVDIDDLDGASIVLFGYDKPLRTFACIPLPSDDDYGVFLIDCIDDSRVITGSISTSPTTIHYTYGSLIDGGNNAYRITGNGSYTFIGI